MQRNELFPCSVIIRCTVYLIQCNVAYLDNNDEWIFGNFAYHIVAELWELSVVRGII